MNSADDNLNPIKSESAETEKNESENISTELKAPSSANNSFNPVRNKEDEEKANRNALISAFWFFGGTLLHFWCLIFQDAQNLPIIFYIIQ